MTIARQIADMIDSGGDVVAGALDNVPDSDWNTILNKPAQADVDTRDASNITAGTIPTARLGGSTANSSSYLRGDGQWVTNCTNHANCATMGTGTITAGSGQVNVWGPTNPGYGGTACGGQQGLENTTSGATIVLGTYQCQGQCACACACACNC